MMRVLTPIRVVRALRLADNSGVTCGSDGPACAVGGRGGSRYIPDLFDKGLCATC